jgi:uncharacterized protein (DUF302 family)
MPEAKDGLIHIPSPFSVPDTLQKLEAILRDKGMTIFARIDHSGEAAKVGMEMHPTQLLIFGNPRGGTPPMLAAPTLAIDLPLKALVWEDAEGKIWITHNRSEYLQRRHGFPREFLQNLAGAATLIQKAVE